jgi:hypothetical protein
MGLLIDLQSLSKAFTSVEKVFKFLREGTGKLPDTPDKDAAVLDLKYAEEQLEIAQVQIADSLGYVLCRKHFPPGIMLKVREGVFSCQKCNDTIGRSGPHQTPDQERFL